MDTEDGIRLWMGLGTPSSGANLRKSTNYMRKGSSLHPYWDLQTRLPCYLVQRHRRASLHRRPSHFPRRKDLRGLQAWSDARQPTRRDRGLGHQRHARPALRRVLLRTLAHH
jgi:hypothetical protein